MSKILYINNKKVTIDDEQTYFPFTYNISDLENINVIGTVVSKTVTIPRVDNNDEIFGYIGDLNRVTIGGTDNLIGLSFNQTKKAIYELYSESELVSKGLLVVESVNDTTYSITLYDEIIDKLEDLTEKYLSEMDIIKTDNSVFNIDSNAVNVSGLNTSVDVIPTFNVKNYSKTGTDIRCLQLSGTTLTTENLSFPQDCTPLQVKSLKDYDVNYAIPLKTVIRSINNYIPNTLTYDSSLDSLFSEVTILSNNPKPEYANTNYTPDAGISGTTLSITYDLVNSGQPIMKENGNYYFDLNYQIKYWKSSSTPDSTIMIVKDTDESPTSPHIVQVYNGNVADGTTVGYFWIKFTPKFVSGINTIMGKPIIQRIDLIKGVNTTFQLVGSGYKYMTVDSRLVFSLDFYPKIFSSTTPNSTSFDVQIFNYDPNVPARTYIPLGTQGSFVSQQFMAASTINYTTNDFHTGCKLNGKTLLPKISIQDFIIQVAKYFNLGVKVDNGSIKLHKKQYYKTNELLIVDNNPELKTNLISYSQLILSNGLSENSIMKDYNTNTKKIFGEQIINTGYSIKKVKKNITLPPSIPFLLKDYNGFAYDRFTKYVNGGYSKGNYGVVEGFDNKLAFGYVQEVRKSNITLTNLNKTITNETITVTNDTLFEAGLYFSGGTIPDEQNFIMSNPILTYNINAGVAEADKWYYQPIDGTSTNYKVLDTYYTFSPYKIINGIVSKSLELNKPLYNFAKIQDSKYDDTATAYYRFQKNMLEDKLNVDTHILQCKIYIDGKVDIYKIYNYKNTWYIISSIVEYDPTQPGLYQVELMKVNDPENYIETFGSEYGIVSTYPYYSVGTGIGTTWNVLHTSINSGGSVLYVGIPNFTDKGVVISTNPNPTISDTKVSTSGTTIGDYRTMITGLTPLTYYYYRAYITTKLGTSYGSSIYNRTCGVPTLTSNALQAINPTYAVGGGIISDDGCFWQNYNPYKIIKYGICYSHTNSTPTIADTIIELTNGSPTIHENESYSLTMTSLTPNTLYYYRSYATNIAGVGYGQVRSFTTLP